MTADRDDHRAQKAPDTTIVTASNGSELSPIEAAIMDACNALHECRQSGDQGSAYQYREALEELIRRYEETDGEGHPNPAWSRPNQRALAQSAMGLIQDAVRTELLALKYADTPRRREISLGNLADRCLRLGDPELAMGYFLEAIDANPDSLPVLLTGAQAMFRSGHQEEANSIFEAILGSPGLLEPGSELSAYLAFDPGIRAMRGKLTALDDLYSAWEGEQRGAEGGAM